MICDHRLVDSYNSHICNLPCKLDTSIHRVPGMLRKYQTPSPSMFHPQKINFMDKIMSKNVYINLSLHYLGGIYKMLIFSNGWSKNPMVFSHCFLASQNFRLDLRKSPWQHGGAWLWHLLSTQIISWPARRIVGLTLMNLYTNIFFTGNGVFEDVNYEKIVVGYLSIQENSVPI